MGFLKSPDASFLSSIEESICPVDVCVWRNIYRKQARASSFVRAANLLQEHPVRLPLVFCNAFHEDEALSRVAASTLHTFENKIIIDERSPDDIIVAQTHCIERHVP